MFMESVQKVASYIYRRYREQFGQCIDEMKLHKLLYFCQRESIVQTGEPMFEDKFQAWRYGPVLVGIRQMYKDGSIKTADIPVDIQSYASILDWIFEKYASKDAWSLSTITHGESSWQKAREDCLPDAFCDKEIETSDIRKDAERIKMRRYLLSKFSDKKTVAL